MGRSRTSSSIKNATITTVTQFISLGVMFLNRTIFIHYLGNEYLSVQGLFTNILLLLSFTELGIGSAIIFSLYKPIADNDEKKISAIMNLFRRSYNWIAIVITILGICILPLLNLIIKEPPNIEESLIIIYTLFLTNTIASYIFSYKKAILTADQKEYIVTIYQQSIVIIQTIAQILILMYTGSFILYLIIQIFCTLLNNIITYRKANKQYPFLQKYKSIKLSSDEKKSIFSNIKSIFFYKLGSVILTGTDNIIISATLNISFIGLVSNYTLIINAINSVVTRVFESIIASVGSLTTTENSEKMEEVFNQLQLIVFWAFGFCSLCLIILLNPFIDLWLGGNFLLSQVVIISLVSVFYVLGMNIPASIYRTTLGYFSQVKFTPIFAALLNIILSLILVKKIGLSGIFFGTALARLFTFSIIDPILIYKKAFNISPIHYYKNYIKFFLVFLLAYFSVQNIIEILNLDGFIAKLLLCTIITNFVFFICFYKTKTFNLIKLRLYNISARGKS